MKVIILKDTTVPVKAGTEVEIPEAKALWLFSVGAAAPVKQAETRESKPTARKRK